MIHIADKQIFINISNGLTSTVVKKHFPHCELCSAGNMAQRPIPRTFSDRENFPGDEIQVDIKVLLTIIKLGSTRALFEIIQERLPRLICSPVLN